MERYKHPEEFGILADFTRADIDWQAGRDLYSWWLEAKAESPYPSRASFSPAKLLPWLPWIIMHDVGAADSTYRIRLMGTEIVAVLGYEATGTDLDDVPNSEILRHRYNWVVRTGKPYICKDHEVFWAKKDYRRYSSIVLPLGERESGVNMLIAALTFS